MATMTISLSEPMKEWVDRHVEQSDYGSASDYLLDLIRRDRERRDAPDLTIEDLRRIVEDARAGGDGGKPLRTIIAEGDRIAASRGVVLG